MTYHRQARNRIASILAAQTTLESDTSGYETSSPTPLDSQSSASRRKNVAQHISKDDGDDELETIVLGPRQPNSIELAITKNRM